MATEIERQHPEHPLQPEERTELKRSITILGGVSAIEYGLAAKVADWTIKSYEHSERFGLREFLMPVLDAGLIASATYFLYLSLSSLICLRRPREIDPTDFSREWAEWRARERPESLRLWDEYRAERNISLTRNKQSEDVPTYMRKR